MAEDAMVAAINEIYRHLKSTVRTSEEVSAILDRSAYLVPRLWEAATRVRCPDEGVDPRAHDLYAYHDDLWDDYLLFEAQDLVDYLSLPGGCVPPPF